MKRQFDKDEGELNNLPKGEGHNTLSQAFVRIPGCVRFLLGACFGMMIFTTCYFLFCPPSGPNYGEGIGWGMILIVLVLPAGAIVGGLIAGLWGVKVY